MFSAAELRGARPTTYTSCPVTRFGDNVDLFLQNKRKLSSIVVFCGPCSCKWQILAILKVFRSAFT